MSAATTAAETARQVAEDIASSVDDGSSDLTAEEDVHVVDGTAQFIVMRNGQPYTVTVVPACVHCAIPAADHLEADCPSRAVEESR